MYCTFATHDVMALLGDHAHIEESMFAFSEIKEFFLEIYFYIT